MESSMSRILSSGPGLEKGDLVQVPRAPEFLPYRENPAEMTASANCRWGAMYSR